ncbi:hypothetical protein THAOC_02298 [Thalassiosira oceanica]|uniref:Uncharacterized protein n=1 Tax=Thalassiosira oceanica TaxID=159749 RepID=K0TB14_THAOC|nr:hypothetical protein THAOC_02298 [Thalassiosira oceanica]|eukprot:EJK75963.1 hypothetical protein THAOC_02298 [Thalassiosira oceanica]
MPVDMRNLHTLLMLTKSKFEGKLAEVNAERAEHGADPISWASLGAPPLEAQNAFVAPTAEGDTSPSEKWLRFIFNIRKFFETADTNKVFTFTGVFFYTNVVQACLLYYKKEINKAEVITVGDLRVDDGEDDVSVSSQFDDLRMVDDDDEDDVAVSESIQDMLAGDFNEEDENGDAVSEMDEDISETPDGYDDDESDGDDWGGDFASIRAKAVGMAETRPKAPSKSRGGGRGSAAPKTRKTRRGKGRDRWLKERKERRDRDEARDENPPDAKESVETEPDEGDTDTDSSAPDDRTGTLLLRSASHRGRDTIHGERHQEQVEERAPCQDDARRALPQGLTQDDEPHPPPQAAWVQLRVLPENVDVPCRALQVDQPPPPRRRQEEVAPPEVR